MLMRICAPYLLRPDSFGVCLRFALLPRLRGTNSCDDTTVDRRVDQSQFECNKSETESHLKCKALRFSLTSIIENAQSAGPCLKRSKCRGPCRHWRRHEIAGEPATPAEFRISVPYKMSTISLWHPMLKNDRVLMSSLRRAVRMIWVSRKRAKTGWRSRIRVCGIWGMG